MPAAIQVAARELNPWCASHRDFGECEHFAPLLQMPAVVATCGVPEADMDVWLVPGDDPAELDDLQRPVEVEEDIRPADSCWS